MQINLEATEKHAIQGYDDHMIQINSVVYESSLIVSREEIITDLAIKNIQELDESFLDLIVGLKPEVVIIGYDNPGVFPPVAVISYLSQQRIGLECMSIGAACRTYNVLLSEMRSVVGGFVFR